MRKGVAAYLSRIPLTFVIQAIITGLPGYVGETLGPSKYNVSQQHKLRSFRSESIVTAFKAGLYS